jgi:hypothetical protein
MSPQHRPSAADRLARGSNPPAQTASRTISSSRPTARVKPVRLTVDLQPGDYDALRDWAHVARMSHSDVLRALVRTLVTADSASELAEQVRQYGKGGGADE